MLAGPCACIHVANGLSSGITHRLGKKTLDPQVGNLLASSLDFGHGDKAFLGASTDRALRAPDSGEKSLSQHSLTPYTRPKCPLRQSLTLGPRAYCLLPGSRSGSCILFPHMPGVGVGALRPFR